MMEETIPALFIRQAIRWGRKPLFLVKRRSGSYQPVAWAEVLDDVSALSIFLLAQQIQCGDRVLILSESRPEWGMADVAIQSVGAWTVPLYPSLTEQDLGVICKDCQPVGAVVSNSDQVNKLLAVNRQASSIRCIVVMEPAQEHQVLVKKWEDALAKGRDMALKLRDLLEHRRSHIRPDDTATIIYTSGTTGEPKGVMLSHRNLLFDAAACLQVIPVTEQDLHLSILPLSHVFERMAGWYLMLLVGASVAYAESMETVARNLLEVRPTMMLAVPRFFEKLYARIQEGMRTAPGLNRRIAAWAVGVGSAVTARLVNGKPLPMRLRLERWVAGRLVFGKIQAQLGGRLRFFVSGSAPLSEEIGTFLYGMGVTILEGYGLTETSPVITVNRLPVPRFGSVGRPIPGVEVRIAEDGEILTRGPHVMQGYYKKPGPTAEAIVEGWFHTGDIGHLDADGYLVITDRKKDLIKTAGGKFIAPQKLESLFLSDPYISQAFVYGDRRPYCVALLVPRIDPLRRYAQEQHMTPASWRELVNDPRIMDFYWSRVQAKQEELAGFEQVKKIALLDQEFTQAEGELTPTLTAKRAVIAQRYEPVLRRLYQ